MNIGGSNQQPQGINFTDMGKMFDDIDWGAALPNPSSQPLPNSVSEGTSSAAPPIPSTKPQLPPKPTRAKPEGAQQQAQPKEAQTVQAQAVKPPPLPPKPQRPVPVDRASSTSILTGVHGAFEQKERHPAGAFTPRGNGRVMDSLLSLAKKVGTLVAKVEVQVDKVLGKASDQADKAKQQAKNFFAGIFQKRAGEPQARSLDELAKPPMTPKEMRPPAPGKLPTPPPPARDDQSLWGPDAPPPPPPHVDSDAAPVREGRPLPPPPGPPPRPPRRDLGEGVEANRPPPPPAPPAFAPLREKGKEEVGEHAVPDDHPPHPGMPAAREPLPRAAAHDAGDERPAAIMHPADVEEVAVPQKPNLVLAALKDQLLVANKETGERGGLKPEADRKELAASFAMGHKIAGLDTKQFMEQLKQILVSPNASSHEKQFALDALHSWVNQGLEKNDLKDPATLQAFKSLAAVVPKEQREEILGDISSKAAAVAPRKTKALSEMQVANDPAALMQRVRNGKASKKDILAAATAIRDGALSRYARVSPEKIARGQVIVDAKHLKEADPALMEATKVMDAFNLQFKELINGAATAKEAESILRFYQNAASTLLELGDLDSAFTIYTALTDMGIYETFRDKFSTYVDTGPNRWDRFLDKCLGEKIEGSPRGKLDVLVNPSKNNEGVRVRMDALGEGARIRPFALVSKYTVTTLADPKFVLEGGVPDMEQLQMAKKAVLDPLNELREMGNNNRRGSHPLQEQLLPKAMIDQAVQSLGAPKLDV